MLGLSIYIYIYAFIYILLHGTDKSRTASHTGDICVNMSGDIHVRVHIRIVARGGKKREKIEESKKMAKKKGK